jgi:U4/U6.U5 tri-snRNP-associated protein 1
VRNRRELNASLKGTTLGDAEEDVDDTLKWVKRNKKKAKELAKKRQEEFENRDKQFMEEYTERMSQSVIYSILGANLLFPGDLAGLKVSHDFDEMDEGEARILTLKDSRILDNEGAFNIESKLTRVLTPPIEDELQNVEMAEEERRKERQELKIKKRDYTGYDDDEFAEGAQGLMKRSILAKYDEDIEGPQHSEFRLGSSTTLSGKAKKEEEKKQAAASVNKSLLSIDYASKFDPAFDRSLFSQHVAENLETTDYIQEGDIGFKKPKVSSGYLLPSTFF